MYVISMDVYKYWKHSSGLKELIQSLCSSWTQIQEILILPCRRTKVLSAKVVALCHTWQPANAKRLSPCTTKIQLTHAFGKAWGYCSTQHLFEHLQHEQQCYGRQHRIIKKFKQKQKKKKKRFEKTKCTKQHFVQSSPIRDASTKDSTDIRLAG